MTTNVLFFFLTLVAVSSHSQTRNQRISWYQVVGAQYVQLHVFLYLPHAIDTTRDRSTSVTTHTHLNNPTGAAL